MVVYDRQNHQLVYVKIACHAIEEGRLQPEPRSATGQQALAAEQL